tara:strand:+ start:5081 stop:6331 length:1251 start_codon:yes stop_codon:yes gene_type:complete
MCFDGTWATAEGGKEVTNVVKLLRSIENVTDDGISQFVGYEPGVGSEPGNGIGGGAFGSGLDRILISGYRFLANNYLPGDEIYIFGFSRGAYTARSLAGLIGLAGMLRPSSLGHVLEGVIEIYRSDDSREDKRLQLQQIGSNERYADVSIRCVGVWDTVGSLGVPGQWWGGTTIGKKYNFHDVSLSPSVEVALHALAIDEKRSAFPPTLWDRDAQAQPVSGQIVEQVWFAGVHSNVGGSYGDAMLSDIALDWMVKRVKAHTALKFDEQCISDFIYPKGRAIESCVAGKGVESRTLLYSVTLSRVYPFLRTINGIKTPTKGADRFIRDNVPQSLSRRNAAAKGLETVNEAIHISVLDRWRLPAVEHDAPETRAGDQQPYRPKNLAAVVDEAKKDPSSATPVVGWDGNIIAPEEVDWP